MGGGGGHVRWGREGSGEGWKWEGIRGGGGG